MKKWVLCLALGAYSVGIIAYALSEAVLVAGQCVQCYKDELPFPPDDPNGSAARTVTVQYNTGNQTGAFNGAEADRLEPALSSALTAWNLATDGNGNYQPFTLRWNQSAPANEVNLRVEVVDEIPGKPDACAGLAVSRNPDGSIRNGVIRIKRSVLNSLTAAQLSLLIQHELGHFMGLADNYNAGRCNTIMNQASRGCVPLATGIQPGDVSRIRSYVAGPNSCKRKRGRRPPLTVDCPECGFMDPAPSPIYYPRTCYLFWEAVDIYAPCDCSGGRVYIGTLIYLTDVFCF